MTEKKLFSIKGSRKEKALVEHIAEIIFTVCAFFAVLAVISITAYMFINGTPALFQVGITDILFGDRMEAGRRRALLRNPIHYPDVDRGYGSRRGDRSAHRRSDGCVY